MLPPAGAVAGQRVVVAGGAHHPAGGHPAGGAGGAAAAGCSGAGAPQLRGCVDAGAPHSPWAACTAHLATANVPPPPPPPATDAKEPLREKVPPPPATDADGEGPRRAAVLSGAVGPVVTLAGQELVLEGRSGAPLRVATLAGASFH